MDLLDPALAGPAGAARLRAALAALLGFHRAVEAQVDAWAAGGAPEATALEWPHRRKAHLAAADLRAAGAGAQEVAGVAPMALPPLAGTGGALGALYVSEGSTLGGQVVARHLQGSGVPVPSVLRPYGGATGPRWQAYRATARAWAGDDPARADALVQGAVTTFDALDRHCRGLVPERAA
ncbi:heme oxygenase [Vallicoccus soli]|uniref:Heme oxygenase n=1 Tax=Vallicoccus soli TaxID=2339232 RepID=A0A3A3YXG0_9ACTN|nr:heme oxygenase [Vallicoccus soli]